MGAGWSDVRHVLAVRLDALGDVLMTGPALRALKESAPDRRVTLLTSPAGAAAARLLPGVDEVIVYGAPWMKATRPRGDSAEDHAMIARLRAAEFDAAVVFTVYSQNPLPAVVLCYLADIPRRLAHCRENPYYLLTDWVRETEPAATVRHEVRRQLDLVAGVGCTTPDERLRLELPGDATEWARQLLLRLGLEAEERWLVLHPGASAPSRRYPPELFATAARTLVHEERFRIVLTGSPAEAEIVEQVRAAVGGGCDTLVGAVDLPRLAALLARAPLVLTNNTGPAHVAAAVGTPVVDLYALTNPQHTPWGVPHRVLSHDVPCRWCYKSICPEGHNDCLRLVPPADVVRAVRELFTERQRPARRPITLLEDR